jgi:hypothetical protein
MTTVTFTASVELPITARVDLSAPDAIVLDCYIAGTCGSIVWLPENVRAAVLRAAIIEAKDTEAAYADIDARR